jgi:hypothetical protein
MVRLKLYIGELLFSQLRRKRLISSGTRQRGAGGKKTDQNTRRDAYHSQSRDKFHQRKAGQVFYIPVLSLVVQIRCPLFPFLSQRGQHPANAGGPQVIPDLTMPIVLFVEEEIKKEAP